MIAVATAAVIPIPALAGGLWRAWGHSFWYRQERSPRKADFSGTVNIDDLDFHLIAFLEVVFHIVHALMRDLGDVEESVLIRENPDKSSELDDLLDSAFVGLADFSHGENVVDHLNRLL